MNNKQELGGLYLQDKYGVDGDPEAVRNKVKLSAQWTYVTSGFPLPRDVV